MASSEPEKYSIDEMMDRLKRPHASPSSGEGTLVTREDGTQVMRVRTRKRRSRQPAKEQAKLQRRIRAVQIAVGVTLLLLAILAVGGMLIYVNTSAFRTRLMAKLGQATGGVVEASQFRVTPVSASAQSLQVNWPESSVLKKLTVKGVDAELRANSFFGGGWNGEEVRVEATDLQVGAATGGASLATEKRTNDFKFARIRSPKTSIVIGDSVKPAVRIKDSEVSFYPKNGAGRAELRMHRGTVEFGPELPAFDLDRSLFVFNGDQIDRVALRLNPRNDPKGGIEFTGAIASSSSAGRPATVDVKFTSFPLEQLTGKKAARFLSGLVISRESTTANALTFIPTHGDSYRLTAGWQNTVESPLKMAGLDCFSDIARLVSDSWFAAPVFDGECFGVLRLEKSGTRLDELDLTAKNRLKVKGSLTVSANDSLSGQLRIGIPVSFALADDTGRLNQLLGPEVEGFRWVDVEVAGTPAKPADNFRDKLGGLRVKPAAPTEIKPEMESRFEELTQPR